MRALERDIADLRDRDPGFVCAYCATPLATPFRLMGTGAHLAWEHDGWELTISDTEDPYWNLLDGHREAHREHVVPRAGGGTDGLDNLVLACSSCNAKKKALPLLLFLARRAGCPRFRSVGGDNAAIFGKAWGRAA